MMNEQNWVEIDKANGRFEDAWGELRNAYVKQISVLEKQLDIAIKALKEYAELETIGQEARQALKEIVLVGTSMSLAKEEE